MRLFQFSTLSLFLILVAGLSFPSVTKAAVTIARIDVKTASLPATDIQTLSGAIKVAPDEKFNLLIHATSDKEITGGYVTIIQDRSPDGVNRTTWFGFQNEAYSFQGVTMDPISMVKQGDETLITVTMSVSKGSVWNPVVPIFVNVTGPDHADTSLYLEKRPLKIVAQ